jgi:hypothetical protein
MLQSLWGQKCPVKHLLLTMGMDQKRTRVLVAAVFLPGVSPVEFG